MSLSGDIETAVETIRSGIEGTSPTPPASDGTAPPASGAASPPAPPAAGAGSASASTSPVLPPASATPTPATVDDDERLDGPVPLDRHQKILANARRKEQERLASLYGVAPDQFEKTNLKPFISTLLQDPMRAYDVLGRELKAAGWLKDPPSGAAAPAKPITEADLPKPTLQAEDGSPAYTAGDTVKVVNFLVDQKLREVLAKVDPLIQSHQASQLDAYTKAQVAEVSKWDHFEALKPKMIEFMRADGRVTIQSAYYRALREYLPQYEKDIRQKTIAELKTAPAATSPQLAPGSTVVRTGPTGKRKGLSWDEAAKQAIDSYHAAKA